MADQDFNIKVVTTADTTGLKETEAGIDRINASVQQQLDAAGAKWDAQKQQFVSVREETEETSGAIEEQSDSLNTAANAAQVLSTGVSFSNRQMVALGHILASGGVQLRNLTHLFQGLGPAAVGASIGGFILYEGIKKAREESQKLISETVKLGEEYTKSAMKLQEMVDAARSSGDISKIAESVLPELDKLHDRANDLNNKTISFWQKQMEDFREGIIQMSPTVTDAMREWAHPFTMELREAQEQATNMSEFADREAKRRIERAADFKRQSESLQTLAPEEAVTKLTQRLQEAENVQANLSKDGEDYVKSWIKQQEIIDRTKKDLQEYIKYQKELNKEVSGIGDAQSKAILKNEDAAKAAAKAGQDRDAEMFQKSADAFRRGATPKELQDVDRVRQLQSGTRDTAAATQDIIKAIKDNTSVSQMILDAWK